MGLAVCLLGVSLMVASLLPFVRREAWWIRVFDFPRLQILLLGLISLGLIIFFSDIRSWLGSVALIGAGSAVLLEAASVFPYTALARKEVLGADKDSPASSLSLLIANVFMENQQYDRLLALVAEYTPDIILLLEPDARWEEHMRAVEKDYTYTVKEPRENSYGMLVYSRLPLIAPEIRYLLRDGIPSMHMRVRLRTGAVLWLHGVHPEPPSPTEADTSLPRDAELLIIGREVKRHAEPTIVAGDLNDVAWSYTTRLFQRTSGLLDPRKGRGMFNTFHARIPFLRWPLDHVFHSNDFVLGDLQRLPAFGSDHFPVYVRLVLQPGVERQQETPVEHEKDEKIATEKIREGEKVERIRGCSSGSLSVNADSRIAEGLAPGNRYTPRMKSSVGAKRDGRMNLFDRAPNPFQHLRPDSLRIGWAEQLADTHAEGHAPTSR